MSLIAGSQIYMHSLRMILQTMRFTLNICSIVFLSTFAYQLYFIIERGNIGFYFTFLQAYVMHRWLDMSDQYVTFCYSNKACSKLPANILLGDGDFSTNFSLMNKQGLETLQFSVIIALIIGCLILAFWSVFGKYKQKQKNISGEAIKEAAETASILKKSKLASKLTIGNVPLVKNSENQHILLVGSTGVGKTTGFFELAPQVRADNQSAFVIDFTGQMVERFYDEKTDIILSPFDERAYDWDLFEDISTNNYIDNAKVKNIAAALFDNKRSSDPFWNNSSKKILTDCLFFLSEKGFKGTKFLKFLLFNISARSLYNILQDYPASTLLAPENAKTAASILSVLNTGCDPLGLLKDSEKKFSFKKWISEIDDQSRGRWVFITTNPSNREAFQPLVNIWMRLIISNIMDL